MIFILGGEEEYDCMSAALLLLRRNIFTLKKVNNAFLLSAC